MLAKTHSNVRILTIARFEVKVNHGMAVGLQLPPCGAVGASVFISLFHGCDSFGKMQKYDPGFIFC